jgi:hypothetical protein
MKKKELLWEMGLFGAGPHDENPAFRERFGQVWPFAL